MNSRFTVVNCLLISLMAFGCGSKRQFGPRVKTTPLTGIVQVDGEPAEMVTVQCVPAAGSPDTNRALMTSTDADGQFTLSTYESGDGLPAGKYNLAFTWIPFGRQKKDKLNGYYADPLTSKISVEVVDGEANDMGVIELSTKGPPK